jgi:hypothetical protein
MLNEPLSPPEIVPTAADPNTPTDEVPDTTIDPAPETPASIAAAVQLEYERTLETFRREVLELAENQGMSPARIMGGRGQMLPVSEGRSK